MKIHDLKIDPQPFADLVSGAKTCEIRNDDRGFEVGDMVRFPGGYTRTISHIQRGYGLPDGLCVLSYAQASAAPEQEPIAWLNLDKLAVAGMAYATSFKSTDAQTKLYTHPSAEIEQLRESLEFRGSLFAKVEAERNELRKKLAEAQALLRRVQRHGPANVQVGLGGDIDAFLSATAQPAECETCNGHGLIGDLPIECPDCEPAEVKS